MKNEEVANLLYEIADFLEAEDVEYKPRAYRNAARNIEALSEPIEEVHERGELERIDGVGESIAGKISEYLETGELEYYERLRKRHAANIEALTRVEGLGPKRAKELAERLGIQTLDDLENAAERGKVTEIEGFGEKMQEKILDHIERARKGEERTLIGRAFSRAREIRGRLEDADEFDRVTIVGSFRRRCPTVGDIDVLATASDAEAAMERFCSFEDVEEVIARGETKTSIRVPGDLRVDLRIVEPEDYGAALVYFTGSKDHNITIRGRAMDRDWKLNEYGLFDLSEVEAERGEGERKEGERKEGKRVGEKIAGETEEGVYDELGLAFIPPELREDTGEVEAAAAGELPDLVEKSDVRGDLQVHTEYSDGSNSVREMAEKADEKGYEYILISDHGPSRDVPNGIGQAEFEEQREEITTVNEDDEIDVEVLHGVETDVTEDGVGVPDDWFDELDLVVLAMHDQFENPTKRLLDVFETYPVDVFAHPLNRLIHEREPVDLDLDRVMQAAADASIAVEINSQPERLDLPWLSVKEYRDDVTYVVSSDAHSVDELDFLHLGVSQARRGWCEATDVLNAQPLDDVLGFFR